MKGKFTQLSKSLKILWTCCTFIENSDLDKKIASLVTNTEPKSKQAKIARLTAFA